LGKVRVQALASALVLASVLELVLVSVLVPQVGMIPGTDLPVRKQALQQYRSDQLWHNPVLSSFSLP